MKYFSALVALTLVGFASTCDDCYGEYVIPTMRRLFGFDEERYDVREIVRKLDNETYVFTEDYNPFFEKMVIPELCEMTTDKINIYNSYLLDRKCLEEMENVGPQCRKFKCQLAHYVKEHGPRIIYTLFDQESEATIDTFTKWADFFGKELSAAFKELEMCTCGKKFLKAASRCAPFYYSNALFDVMSGYASDIGTSALLLRNWDLEAAGKAAVQLIDHLCEQTSSGMCINSLTKVAGRVGLCIENSYVKDVHGFYDFVEKDDEEGMIGVMKKCDTAWYAGSTVDGSYSSNYVEYFNNLALYTNAWYCDEYCQEQRGIFYPCCMKDMVRDKKMWDNVHKVVESHYRLLDVIYRIVDTGNLHSSYIPPEHNPYDDEYEKMVRRQGKAIRKAFLRWIDGASTCKGGEVECIDF